VKARYNTHRWFSSNRRAIPSRLQAEPECWRLSPYLPYIFNQQTFTSSKPKTQSGTAASHKHTTLHVKTQRKPAQSTRLALTTYCSTVSKKEKRKKKKNVEQRDGNNAGNLNKEKRLEDKDFHKRWQVSPTKTYLLVRVHTPMLCVGIDVLSQRPDSGVRLDSSTIMKYDSTATHRFGCGDLARLRVMPRDPESGLFHILFLQRTPLQHQHQQRLTLSTEPSNAKRKTTIIALSSSSFCRSANRHSFCEKPWLFTLD